MKCIILNIMKPILVITHPKSILIKTIQTTCIDKNHFYINISKHKLFYL